MVCRDPYEGNRWLQEESQANTWIIRSGHDPVEGNPRFKRGKQYSDWNGWCHCEIRRNGIWIQVRQSIHKIPFELSNHSNRTETYHSATQVVRPTLKPWPILTLQSNPANLLSLSEQTGAGNRPLSSYSPVYINLPILATTTMRTTITTKSPPTNPVLSLETSSSTRSHHPHTPILLYDNPWPSSAKITIFIPGFHLEKILGWDTRRYYRILRLFSRRRKRLALRWCWKRWKTAPKPFWTRCFLTTTSMFGGKKRIILWRPYSRIWDVLWKWVVERDNGLLREFATLNKPHDAET